MTYMSHIDRRSFLASATVSAGALTLGFHIPLAHAEDETPTSNGASI